MGVNVYFVKCNYGNNDVKRHFNTLFNYVHIVLFMNTSNYQTIEKHNIRNHFNLVGCVR